MAKAIKIEMLNDTSLKISVNGEEKITLPSQGRNITAEAIYNIIGFTGGDKYSVVSENESGVDSQVLEFFAELFVEIINKVNNIEVESQQTHRDASPT